jgi:hypothetical protein
MASHLPADSAPVALIYELVSERLAEELALRDARIDALEQQLARRDDAIRELLRARFEQFTEGLVRAVRDLRKGLQT